MKLIKNQYLSVKKNDYTQNAAKKFENPIIEGFLLERHSIIVLYLNLHITPMPRACVANQLEYRIHIILIRIRIKITDPDPTF